MQMEAAMADTLALTGLTDNLLSIKGVEMITAAGFFAKYGTLSVTRRELAADTQTGMVQPYREQFRIPQGENGDFQAGAARVKKPR